ncbi:MAG: HD domain-containing protein [Aliivibrio sp.]|uniref:HD domain-containing protein n=1 Tax=Aliivibrio sp. TaxID=1872443 RepID=UPI001A5C6F9E|nr:HD domain-containing protein [Aliivibrio sp.]
MAKTIFDMKENREWEVLPLFPELDPYQTVFRAMDSLSFADPFFVEIINSRPMQRLKKIGFLGAIDYVRYGNGRESHRRRHNRYDHSVGVAQLALRYAKIRELSEVETRILVASGLLHDIGHGPLSHTLEPVFKEKFGISHHMVGNSILSGKSLYKDEIRKIFSSYGIDLDEVNAMIEGNHFGPHSFLFSGPINIDTIEGITRCRSFFARSSASAPALEIIEQIANSTTLPTQVLDKFWELKHDVYNIFIHHNSGLIYDGLAQAYMLSKIDRFRPSVFLGTEGQLRNIVPTMFHMFSWAQRSNRRVLHRVAEDFFNYEVRALKRDFMINADVNLNTTADLEKRYQQKKYSSSIAIGSLLERYGSPYESIK